MGPVLNRLWNLVRPFTIDKRRIIDALLGFSLGVTPPFNELDAIQIGPVGITQRPDYERLNCLLKNRKWGGLFNLTPSGLSANTSASGGMGWEDESLQPW